MEYLGPFSLEVLQVRTCMLAAAYLSGGGRVDTRESPDTPELLRLASYYTAVGPGIISRIG